MQEGKRTIKDLTEKQKDKLISDIIDDIIEYGADSYEELGREIITKLKTLELVDYGKSRERQLMEQFECLGATLDKVQFKRLCEACDYDEDVLEDFDKDTQKYYRGTIGNTNFIRAFTEDRIDTFIDEYDAFYHNKDDEIER